MKKLVILVAILSISSCDEPEYRFSNYGMINNIRVDDDGEYHFDTDYKAYHDIPDNWITIKRENIETPWLYVKEKRCPPGKLCTEDTIWRSAENYSNICYTIHLPLKFKIQPFND